MPYERSVSRQLDWLNCEISCPDNTFVKFLKMIPWYDSINENHVVIQKITKYK